MFFLSAHYAHPIDYTEEKIEEAKKALERILILMDKVEKMVTSHKLQVTSRKLEEIEEIKSCDFS